MLTFKTLGEMSTPQLVILAGDGLFSNKSITFIARKACCRPRCATSHIDLSVNWGIQNVAFYKVCYLYVSVARRTRFTVDSSKTVTAKD